MAGDGAGLLINCWDEAETAHLGSADCRSAADREIFGIGSLFAFFEEAK